MALIITPGQLAQRASFYYQLAQVTAAGLSLINALEQIQRSPPARSYRQPIAGVLQSLSEGFTFTESLRRQPDWLPAFDTTLLEAGEESGRLDGCFRLLAKYYEERASLTRQMIADLIYPFALLHFAVFILPFPDFFMSGNLFAYLTQTLGVLLPLYGIIAAIVYAAQNKHGEHWRSLLEGVMHRVPVLGSARRELALARLSAALEALLSAGVTIVEAWDLAATASGSPALRRTVAGWRPLFEAGRTPAEAIQDSREFPQLFANQYASGEVSGRLDDSLVRLHRYYQEEGSRRLHMLAQWTPRLIYFAVVLVIAYRILAFWTGYFGRIQDVMGM